MIDRIVIENFKSLRKVDLSLGRLNLFIGANASGKSNFLDALRVLQGIGNGFTIGEILDGKPRSATSEVWDGIRGGSSNACFAFADAGNSATPPTSSDTVTIQARGSLDRCSPRTWEFLISFSPSARQVTRERLEVDAVIYDSDDAIDSPETGPRLAVRCYNETGLSLDAFFASAAPALGQVARGYFAQASSEDATRGMNELMPHIRVADELAAGLANAQRIDPQLFTLRGYSQIDRARRMGDRGENFSAVVNTICEDDDAKKAYLSWLQELRPEEVSGVGVLRGALGEPLFMLREGNRDVPAPVLSDGTLRFAAIAAAFFQPDMPRIMTIEEVENGVHPSRLRLLLELFRSQTEQTGTQVFATTHSPLVLAWLQEEEEYKTTFFCRRNEQTGESEIRPLTDVPRLMDVVGKPGQHLEDLFAEGWLEAAL